MSTRKETLTVTDNRTGNSIEIPIGEQNEINSVEFAKLKDDNDEGIVVFDNGLVNTAVTESSITHIDGKNGKLEYRGIDVEELIENDCSFLEVAYLVINGELPTAKQLEVWEGNVMRHTFIHENLMQLMKQFRYDAHPMGMFIATQAAASTFHPEANPSLTSPDLFLKNDKILQKQIYRILGKSPSIAACAYRHRIGRPYNYPRNGLSYTDNLLFMLDSLNEPGYHPNPVLSRALEKLLIVHIDHGLNCSTAAMRHVGSSGVDPYSAIAAASSALYGPYHGGASSGVLYMLESIASVDNVPAFIEKVKKKECRLMGFGHRVYKAYDPRAKIVRKILDDVMELFGSSDPLLEIATALEKTALEDEYFIKRKLFPNVDFYTGLIYRAMGFPLDFVPVLFALGRQVGWLAHWIEGLKQRSFRIYRPRQVYTGPRGLDFIRIEDRGDQTHSHSSKRHRRDVAHHVDLTLMGEKGLIELIEATKSDAKDGKGDDGKDELMEIKEIQVEEEELEDDESSEDDGLSRTDSVVDRLNSKNFKK